MRARRTSIPSSRALKTISGWESSPVTSASGIALEQSPGRLAGPDAELEDPPRRERDRVDRRLLELVVARDVGPDLVQVGLRVHVELGAHAHAFRGPPLSVISIEDASGISQHRSRAVRPAPGRGPQASSWTSIRASSSSAASATRPRERSPRRASTSRGPRPATRSACASSLTLAGPCMRCLEDADVAVEVDAREVDQPRTADEELPARTSTDDELDLGALGPRRAGARAAAPAPVPSRLRGPLPGLRGVA